jgi:signal peptidase I
MLGLHWVGDLILDCQVDVESDRGSVLFDLVKGGRHFGCDVDVATGRAHLSLEGVSDWHPTALTALRGPGTHRVMFANADRQLLLWVDGELVAFDRPTTYGELDNERPQSTDRDPGDLAPAGIGSRGAALAVDHLRVLRDIYYIADNVSGKSDPISDYRTYNIVPELTRAELAQFFSQPRAWQTERGANVFDGRRETTFELGPDQFFVLGDNSPSSSDARLWSGQQYVDRELLVGKALFVYWPHPLRLFVPFTDASINVIPNVGRMHFIR